jgi:hypothetical protein
MVRTFEKGLFWAEIVAPAQLYTTTLLLPNENTEKEEKVLGTLKMQMESFQVCLLMFFQIHITFFSSTINLYDMQDVAELTIKANQSK